MQDDVAFKHNESHWFMVLLFFTKFNNLSARRDSEFISSKVASNNRENQRLSHIADIFVNCTTVFDMRNGSRDFALNGIKEPLILVNPELVVTNIDTVQISLPRRKNILGNCYAFILTFPENDYNLRIGIESGGNFKENLIAHRSSVWYYIRQFYFPQYFVWVTKFRSEFQKAIQALGLGILRQYENGNLGDFGLVNFVLIDVLEDRGESGEEFTYNSDILLHCYNRYYSEETQNVLPPWTTISCRNGYYPSCFEDLIILTDKIADLNKYFWTLEAWLKMSNAGPYVDSEVVHFIKSKYLSENSESFDMREVVELTTFEEFVGFWIFQDVLFDSVNKTEPQEIKVLHLLPQIKELMYLTWYYHSVLPIERKSWSFLSCDGVGYHSNMWSPLVTPFQLVVWALVCINILVIVLFLRVPGSDINVKLLVVGILMENSILLNVDSKVKDLWWKHSFRLSSGFFTILFGTILTNYYKTSFTMEMIVPAEKFAMWRTLMDMKNFTFYIPYETVFTHGTIEGLEAENLLDKMFYPKLQLRLLTRGLCNAEEKLIPSLAGYCGMAELLTYSITHRPGSHTEYISPFFKPTRYRNFTQFVKELGTCDKVAYMDFSGNVESAIDHLNDNQNHKVYKKGADGFMSVMHGWESLPVQNNFVFKRLNVMISSGIFKYWDEWFKRVKPEKLFKHYANWKFPEFRHVILEQFNSKIFTAFYAYGICVGIVVITFMVEVVFRVLKLCYGFYSSALPRRCKSYVLHKLCTSDDPAN
ncbi:hypothetical protein Fcan01_16493 [Folsomia candida]|uniref:Uncharacterized protein n=1 Tax=Folsomia candida TaxID=158441 RepID=A0A226DVC4_FOLCA|nr:hypothetical protein Fcan01_16493 [Folsomia candida]